MMIILDHTADRDAYPKLIQHLQSDIYLPPSTIHQDQIRKPCKAVKFSVTLMSEPSGQNLFHAGIIVGSLYPFDLELTIITAFGTAFFINHHGSHRLKATDIGNIVSFHAHHVFQSQPFFHLVNSSDGSSFLPPDPFSVLGKYHTGIFQGKFYQLFLGSLLRDPDVYLLLSSS